MKVDTQKNDGMKKIADLIEGVGAGMLTTPASDGALRSRPMMPLQMDQNGSLWFFTKSSESEKEAAAGHLNLSFADPKNGTFVSLSGRSMLVHDRSKIDELWSPLLKAWFPSGKDDPSLALLRVDVDGGEYWDSSSSSMVRFLAVSASAIVGHQVGLGENQTVSN